MDTLQSLAKRSVAELRAESRVTGCRFYSIALCQLAAAKEAHALGNGALSSQHVERAKTALLRAQEVDADRVARTQRDMAARGTQVVNSGHTHALRAHVSMRETHNSNGSRRGLATSASEATNV